MLRRRPLAFECLPFSFSIKGVWGFAPCLPRALALWRPNDRIANAAGMAHAFYPRPDGLANSFWLRARPDSQIAGAIRHAFAARAFCARYPFHRIKGVWGFAPCSPGPFWHVMCEHALSDKPIFSGVYRTDRFCRSIIRVRPPQEFGYAKRTSENFFK